MDRQNSTTGGRRRVTAKTSSAEDQALNQIAIEAEARLAAKRAARAEAREIRLKEIEKLNREADEAQDRRYHLISERSTDTRAYESTRSTVSCSRQDSEDSTDSASTTSKEMKNLLHDLEEKLKKTMMTNAQLDNEKRTAVYQVDLLKDRLEEQEETLVEAQREYKEKCRELESHKRSYQELEGDSNRIKAQLEHRDKLIQENGLLIVTEESGELALRRSSLPNGSIPSGAALISSETAQLLKKGEGSLEDRLKHFTDERTELLTEVKKLKQDLDDERSSSRNGDPFTKKMPSIDSPEMQLYEMQREASKQIHEYKLKLQKAETDIATLDGSVIRLETQSKRYKQEAEDLEKSEDELKTERRRMQRELREALSLVEDLQTQNKNLNRRIDKIKQTRPTLVGQ